MGDTAAEIKVQFSYFSSNCQKVTKRECYKLGIPCEYRIEGETKAEDWLTK